MGHGICCKPGSTSRNCKNGRTSVCSEPAILQESGEEDDEAESYRDIVTTPDQLNHQMFAFCTLTTQKMCGISKSSSTDMTIISELEAQTISTNSLSYTEGVKRKESRTRKYDSCYYEIGADAEDDKIKAMIEEHQNQLQIEVTVTKATEMNVFLYGGPNRFEATQSVVQDNLRVQVGKTYYIDYTVGFLLLAYPNLDKETEFEFTHKVIAFADTPMARAAEAARKIAEEDERRKVTGHAHYTENSEMTPQLALVSEEGGAFSGQDGMNIAIGVGGIFFVLTAAACCYTSAKRTANRVEMIDPEATVNPVVVLPTSKPGETSGVVAEGGNNTEPVESSDNADLGPNSCREIETTPLSKFGVNFKS